MGRVEVFAAGDGDCAGDAGGVAAKVYCVEGFLALWGAVEADETCASDTTGTAIAYFTIDDLAVSVTNVSYLV